jgi:putative addiction module component (TIGR02574 family)
MAEQTLPADLRDLSVDERILLIEALWDSIAEDQDELEVTRAQQGELDRRLEAHQAAPDVVLSWEQVKASIQPPDE